MATVTLYTRFSINGMRLGASYAPIYSERSEFDFWHSTEVAYKLTVQIPNGSKIVKSVMGDTMLETADGNIEPLAYNPVSNLVGISSRLSCIVAPYKGVKIIEKEEI